MTIKHHNRNLGSIFIFVIVLLLNNVKLNLAYFHKSVSTFGITRIKLFCIRDSILIYFQLYSEGETSEKFCRVLKRIMLITTMRKLYH